LERLKRLEQRRIDMSEGVRLYAGTQHGLIIWRSTDNGWQEVARHFEDGIIDSIHDCKQTPEHIFVGVTHDGLYRTMDAGKSWTKVLDGDIRSVTVDPTNDKVIYSGIEPVGLFAAKTAAITGRKSPSLNHCRKPSAKTGGILSRRTTAMSAIFTFIRTIRRRFICASNTVASCAASIAAKIGRTSARGSTIWISM
jgi:hypothetical protein